MRLLSELNTSHTALYTPDDYQYYILLDALAWGLGDGRSRVQVVLGKRTGTFYPGIGAFTRQVEDRHFVDAILEGSPAERAGLKYGDEILTVDAMPYSPIAAFGGKIGATVELEIRRHSNAAPRAPASFRHPDTADLGVCFAGTEGERAHHRAGPQLPDRLCAISGR